MTSAGEHWATDAMDDLSGRREREAEILAAWCNPKGRVIWFGTVRRIDNGYGLSAAADMADTIVKRLTMFRFRSKVDLNVVDEGQAVDPAFLVENGYPFIGAAQSEQFTPHMLNLDLLGAISFEKGCYPGQEIVATCAACWLATREAQERLEGAEASHRATLASVKAEAEENLQQATTEP